MADDRTTRLAAAKGTLTKVLSFAPNHPLAHYLTGSVENFSNRSAQGIAECERALELDRNLAAAHALIGFAKYVTGRGKKPRLMYRRRSGSVLAIRVPTFGLAGSAMPKRSSASTRKHSHGCTEDSRPTVIFAISHFFRGRFGTTQPAG